ncbi:MAG TPA: hypothetical protein PK863_01890 [Candidatus Dojkabacteria bacterium]|nr:hypothetical protein [Candidatus Dojkabacteria bacterium]HRP50788.1 hypothetical protein [Candidatus Dojkabacteria bacterium]
MTNQIYNTRKYVEGKKKKERTELIIFVLESAMVVATVLTFILGVPFWYLFTF